MQSDRVPMIDLKTQYRSIETEVREAIFGVIESMALVQGPQGAALEREMSEYCGVSHAIGVGSGTDALELALRALDIGPGDEVVVPAFTFIAPASACLLVGARPVFADISPDTYNIDPADVERRLTPKTKAIIAVDLYGQVADMDALERLARDRGLYLIEDAAQSIGATRFGRPAGSFGDCACTSFYPSKNLAAYGEGGMVLTKSESLAEQVKQIRNHGTVAPYTYGRLGRNSRLDEIQAALLRIKLSRLTGWTEERRQRAAMYDELLAETSVTTPYVADQSHPNYYLYTVRSKERDRLTAHLNERGISNVVYYPKPLHTQVPFADCGQGEGDCPETERACREVLSIPLAPELSEEQIRRVAGAIAEFGG